MRITEVRVNIGLTINMGNYESLRVDEGMTVRIDENELASEVITTTIGMVEARLQADARKLGKNHGDRNFDHRNELE